MDGLQRVQFSPQQVLGIYCDLWTWGQGRHCSPGRAALPTAFIQVATHTRHCSRGFHSQSFLHHGLCYKLAPPKASGWRARILSGGLVQNPQVPPPLLPTVEFTASHKRQEAWIRSSPDPTSFPMMFLSCASRAGSSVSNCRKRRWSPYSQAHSLISHDCVCDLQVALSTRHAPELTGVSDIPHPAIITTGKSLAWNFLLW